MSHRFKSAVGILLLTCNCVFAAAGAQVVPVPYPAVPPVPAPAPAESPGTVQFDAPRAYIRGYSLTSEVEPSSLARGSEISLDPGSVEVIVFFDAAAGAAAGSEFRYRLDDYDPDWTVTRDRNAHFRRLPPGRFRFEVQARTPGTAWHSPPALLTIHQQPFFYQTWVFYVLLSVGVVVLAAQLLRQRDQLFKGQMGIILEERNRIAGDCHDTLMAGLAAISWQLEATSKLFRDFGETVSPAERSCELARSMVAHCQAEARRIIWDLRDTEELTNVLSHALSHALTAHRLRGTIDVTFQVEGNEIRIAPGAVHHLVCIGQEAVTNAIRHSGCTRIDINLRYDGDALSLRISDDGHGFLLSDPATHTGHFGIPVMEERARKLGGSLHLNTSLETGTEVAVTVSFDLINRPVKQQHYVVPWIGV